MSQESKFSSEHQTRTRDSDSYICTTCRKVILDHVYLVQRRRIRSVPSKGSPLYPTALKDALDPSHGGVILGPEQDVYCPTCYDKIPTIQELINAHKNGLNLPSKNLD